MAQLVTLLFHWGGSNEIFSIVLQSNNCPLFSRLFYLHQNMVRFISEEGVFMILTWFHPTLCGIIVSMLLGENFLLDSNKTSTTLFFYSLCSKVKFHKEEFMQTIAVYMFTLSSTSIVFATVVTHIILLIRHRQLKKVQLHQPQLMGRTLHHLLPRCHLSHNLCCLFKWHALFKNHLAK